MADRILSQSVLRATDANVDVTLFVLDASDMSGPFSATGVSDDGRRFVAVSDDTDDLTITRHVSEVAAREYGDPDWPDDDAQPHTHTYRSDVSAWWCVECDTNTDYCQQINPY